MHPLHIGRVISHRDQRLAKVAQRLSFEPRRSGKRLVDAGLVGRPGELEQRGGHAHFAQRFDRRPDDRPREYRPSFHRVPAFAESQP